MEWHNFSYWWGPKLVLLSEITPFDFIRFNFRPAKILALDNGIHPKNGPGKRCFFVRVTSLRIYPPIRVFEVDEVCTLEHS